MTGRFLFVLVFLTRLSAYACTPGPELGDADIRLKVCMDGTVPYGVTFKAPWTRGWLWLDHEAFRRFGYTLRADGIDGPEGSHAFAPPRETLPSFGAADVERVHLIARAFENMGRPDPVPGDCSDSYDYGLELINLLRTGVPMRVCLDKNGVPSGVSFKDGERWLWLGIDDVGAYGWRLTEGGLISFTTAPPTVRKFGPHSDRHGGEDGNFTLRSIYRDQASRKQALKDFKTPGANFQ